ncbi:N-terminal nucleophile aminohydrolase [Phlegmacium glaucopus]|nr:N-terminal nucleophile aminohydrolase [Phlegmacium glaucopus]
MTPIAYIAVHGGAGVHAPKHEKEIKHALRKACTLALSGTTQTETSNSPQDGDSENTHMSLTMVEYAIKVLEDDEHFNAGFGSNLTINGTVECDAAIMDGKGAFGSVGAVSGCQNAIRVARAVLDHSRVPDKLGRVPPLTLVSSGAYNFAAGQLETIPPEALITFKTYERWKKWKTRLDSSEDSLTLIDPASQLDTTSEELWAIQDTVGAVAWHGSDGLAAGVSSGGLLLKYPGRVGEAAIFGAGCWASQYESGLDGMACSVSGTGEHIIRTNLARRLGEALRISAQSDEGEDPHDILNRILIDDFGNTCRELGENSPSAGLILLTAEDNCSGDAKVRLWCAFTTPSMAVAYFSTKDAIPKAVIFRRPDNNGVPSNKPQIFITSLSL